MSTPIRKALGEAVRHTVTLAAEESEHIDLDTLEDADYTGVQVTVAAGDSVTVFGSLDDAADVSEVAEQAFPLFGEDGTVHAIGTKRTVFVPFPGRLRTIFVAAATGNTGTARVVVLQ